MYENKDYYLEYIGNCGEIAYWHSRETKTGYTTDIRKATHFIESEADKLIKINPYYKKHKKRKVNKHIRHVIMISDIV
jgi:hypothetical protein